MLPAAAVRVAGDLLRPCRSPGTGGARRRLVPSKLRNKLRNKERSQLPSSHPAPPTAGPPAAPPRTGLPADYVAVLEDIRSRLRTAHVRATLSVNRELIRLYWEIGGLIVRRQSVEGWGKAVIERLAQDLREAFPEMRCFTARNIWHARAFFLAYRDVPTILKQPVSESETVQAEPTESREASSGPPPQPILGIPWGHDILLANIGRFLLELGAGFAFVGQQVRLEVDGEDYCLDLLFYHLRLRCLVVGGLRTQFEAVTNAIQP